MRNSILAIAFVLGAAAWGSGDAPGDRRPGPAQADPTTSAELLSPELVMQHQSEIALQDSQRRRSRQPFSKAGEIHDTP